MANEALILKKKKRWLRLVKFMQPRPALNLCNLADEAGVSRGTLYMAEQKEMLTLKLWKALRAILVKYGLKKTSSKTASAAQFADDKPIGSDKW